LRVKRSKARGRFDVTADGHGMTGRAGTTLLAEAADRTGLTAGLSRAVGGCRSWHQHDPGKVVRDLVVTLADGGDALRHMAVLDNQPELFGEVASPATVNRTIVALGDDELVVERLAVARRAAREVAWQADAAPPVVAAAAGGEDVDEPLCVDFDATLITAHSDDKDGAAKTYKRGWGFHPLGCWLDRGDGTGEALAAMLRPGNAGANTAADHIDVFEAAIWQLDGLIPPGVEVLVRADCAGSSQDFLAYLRQAQVRFSVGYAVDVSVRNAIRALDDDAWTAATRRNGEPRDGAHVAEITDALNLTGYPDGSRVLVRREPLHPGAQQTLADVDGKRFTAFLTDQPDRDLAKLDTRHRAHARVEDRIRGGKDTGARNLPCDTFERNAVWLQLVLAAQDLMSFMANLCLDGDLRVAEPARLRYQLLHVPARIVTSGRRTIMRIQYDWPWAQQLLTAYARLRRLPLPAT
jgi:Transposase DDE domain group 1